MKVKLDKAWDKYKARFRLGKWYTENHPGHSPALKLATNRPSSRRKFEKYTHKLLGKDKQITFEWQENGSCIVAGVIYLELIETA